MRLREAYTLDEVMVPAQVTAYGNTYDVVRIGNEAFKDCKVLKHLLLPMGIREFGEYAFCNCDALLNLSMPSSLLTIERSAFEGCSSLPLIALPNSVTTIGENAFAYCTSIREIAIPASVEYIADGAFKGCPTLEFIFGQHTSADNKCLIMNNRLIAIAPYGKSTFDIPSGVTAIGASTFWGCDKLLSVNIPATVAAIDETAFKGCTALTTADLPEALNAIGSRAFSGCSALQSVVLHENFMLMGDYAYEDCTSLVSVKTYVADPGSLAIGQYVFGTAPPAACTLYVPAGSLALYQAASPWNQFTTIVEFTQSGIETLPADQVTPTPASTYYDLLGRPVNHPTPGLYLLNGRKVLIK